MKGGGWRIAICLAFWSLRTDVFADPILLTFDEVAPGLYAGDLYRDLDLFLGSDFRFEGGGAGRRNSASSPRAVQPRQSSLGFQFLGRGPEGLDNLRIGDLTLVPEPGTPVLVGLRLA